MAKSREEVLADIKAGDRLKWENSFGVRCEAAVGRIIRTSQSFEHGETIEFYSQTGGKDPYKFHSFHRAVALGHITHVNGKRIANLRGRKSRNGVVDLTSEEEIGQADLSLGEAEEADMAKKLQTTTRKSLDEMSDSHRKHIERWEPHLEALRGEHVWAAVSRVPGRGVEGPYYVALKRGAKDYVIVDYDTEKMTPATPKRILADGFESSTALMEAFKEFRQKAKGEREAIKASSTKPKAKAASSKAKTTSKAKAKAKTTAKKPVRKKAPAKSK